MTAPANPVAPPADPAAPPSGAPANPTPAPAAAPPAAAAPSPADIPPKQPAPPADPKEGDGDNAELAKVRKEAAGYRTKLREQEQATAAEKTAREKQTAELKAMQEQIAKIGAIFNPDANQPPDPAKLTEQLTAAQAETVRVSAAKDAEIRNLTIRAALPSILTKASADPGLTEAVLTANGALAKLDPTSATFGADLESAVAAAVEQNPRLKVTPVATRSGAEIPGRTGGSDQLTLEQVRGMKPEQIEEARKAGKLRTLLGG